MKPEFWASESNSRISRDARLLFIGLLNLADDEGRLRGHPGFIAGQVFPFDSDARKVVDRGLAELETEGKVLRYSVSGSMYVVVTKFVMHQKVDARYPSKLPAPPIPADSPPIPAETLAAPADFPPPEQGTGNRERNGEEQGTGTGHGPAAALARLWNESTTPPLPQVADVERLGVVRQKSCKEALARRPLEEWRAVFERINASAFCRGSDGGWKASIDWALRPEGKKPETARLVLEGNYDRHQAAPARDVPVEYPEGRVRL